MFVFFYILFYLRFLLGSRSKPKAHWAYYFWPKPGPFSAVSQDPTAPSQSLPKGHRPNVAQACRLACSPASKPTAQAVAFSFLASRLPQQGLAPAPLPYGMASSRHARPDQRVGLLASGPQLPTRPRRAHASKLATARDHTRPGL